MVQPASRSKAPPTLLAHLLLIAVTLVWGTTFPLVKAALRDVSPLLFNLLRMLFASVVLLAANGSALKGLTRPQLKLCALAGVVLALGYELQTVGLTRTTPSKSAFLTGLVVVLVPILSAVPGVRARHTPHPHGLAFAGAVLALAGIVLLTSEPGAGMELLSGMGLGEWLTLACAVAFAFHLLTLARIAQAIPARALGTLQILFSALTMLVLLPVQGHLVLHWTGTLIAALAVTSVLATAAAFTIQSWAQQHLPASHTALIFLGERLGPRALAGAGSILAGILLAELGPTAVARAGILPMEP